ncbi:unnamed protein product, partial [Ixodes hexagonus]
SRTSGQGVPGNARDPSNHDDGGGVQDRGRSSLSPGSSPRPVPTPPAEDPDMVTRRFKKGSVYEALASQSGFDFSPVVPQSRPAGWAQPDAPRETSWRTPLSTPSKENDSPRPPSHEKYPSWPVTPSPAASTTCRSRSWTQETDYPKEKAAAYVRPKKSFKISTQQLQPVLERACEPANKKTVDEDRLPRPGDGSAGDTPTDCSADAYLSKYDEFLRQYQRWSEAPFLQRLYQEGEREGWPPEAAPSESACDSLGSSGGSSQDTLKWHGSYSDLSAFSTSNGSSLFDSGHSTLPDSGRLSPQSSCDGSLADGSQRLVSPSQAAVARSARVLPPKRHESESVLYYAPGQVHARKTASQPGETSSRVAQLKAAFDPGCESRTGSTQSLAHRQDPASPRVLFLDPEKKHRVSDPELKAIQKQAVLSFYKRQTSQDSKNRSLPRSVTVPKWSVATSETSPKSSGMTKPGTTKPLETTGLTRDPDNPWKGPRSWSVPDLAQPLSVAAKTPWCPQVPSKTPSDPPSRRSCDGILVSRTPSMNGGSVCELPPARKLSVAVQRDSPNGELDGTSTRGKTTDSSQSASLPVTSSTSQEDHPQLGADCKEEVRVESRRDTPTLRPAAGLTPVSGARKAQLREVRLPDRSTPALQLLTSEGVTLAVAPCPDRGSDRSQDRTHASPQDRLKDKSQDKPQGRGQDRTHEQTQDRVEVAVQDRILGLTDGLPQDKAEDRVQGRVLDMVQNNRLLDRRIQDKLLSRISGKFLESRIPDSQDRVSGRCGSPPTLVPPAVPPRRSPASEPKPPPRPPPMKCGPQTSAHEENGLENDDPELQRIAERVGVPHRWPSDPERQQQQQRSLASSMPETSSDVSVGTSASCELRVPPTAAATSSPSACSSPELPLPPPPPVHGLDECRVSPTDDDRPLPPPPEDLVVVTQLGPDVDVDANGEKVYPKNSYMWYRSERKPGRQGFQGNYRRSYHGGCGDSGPESCPGSDQGSEATSEEASSESPSSSCPSSPLAYPPPSWPSPTAAPAAGSNAAASQTSFHSPRSPLTLQPVPVTSCESDSLNNNNSCAANHNNNNNTCITSSERTSLMTGSGDQSSSSCNGCCESPSASSPAASRTTTSAATQTGPEEAAACPLLIQQRCKSLAKSREELECERLSHDFASRFGGDATLRSLLGDNLNSTTSSGPIKLPSTNETDEPMGPQNSASRPQLPQSATVLRLSMTNSSTTSEGNQGINGENYGTAEPIKVLEREGDNVPVMKQSVVFPLHVQEELMASISRKLDVLRVERVSLRDEACQNESLGQALCVRVDLLARPAERDKFRLHVDELDKIVNLLLSLSGRLARVHNALAGLPADDASQERRALEAKRDKLTSQHEEARRLKESIDKRSRQVALFLRRYLSPQEYADYGHFVRMKSKLLVDAREIDDKIRLGEEQLAALRMGGQGSTVTSWKPMVS